MKDFAKILKDDFSCKKTFKKQVYEKSTWLIKRLKEIQVQFYNEIVSEEGRSSGMSNKGSLSERTNLVNNFQMTINTDYLDLVTKYKINNSDINLFLTKGDELTINKSQSSLQGKEKCSTPRELVEKFFKYQISSKSIKDKKAISNDNIDCQNAKKSLFSLDKNKSVHSRECLDKLVEIGSKRVSIIKLEKIQKTNENIIKTEENHTFNINKKMPKRRLWVPKILNKKESGEIEKSRNFNSLSRNYNDNNNISNYYLKNTYHITKASGNISTCESSNENFCVKLPIFCNKQITYFTLRKKNFKKNFIL
jgi:hypothetical protein